MLAPDRRTRIDLFKSTTSDQNGRFQFTDLAPGDYKVFAWDDVERYQWFDPEFVKDYEKQGGKASWRPRER